MREEIKKAGKGNLLRDKAYTELKRSILNGHLKPGTSIPEQAICDSLKLSRTPVREAINKLVSENLIETVPRRGAYVANLSIQEIKEVFELREYFDCMAVRLAIDRIDISELERYEQLFHGLINETEETSLAELSDIDRAFHDMILVATGNRWLKELACILLDRSQLIRTLSLRYPGRMKNSWAEHIELILKLKAKDTKGAEKCALKHVVNAKNAVINAVL